jgi:hypothetical protein
MFHVPHFQVSFLSLKFAVHQGGFTLPPESPTNNPTAGWETLPRRLQEWILSPRGLRVMVRLRTGGILPAAEAPLVAAPETSRNSRVIQNLNGLVSAQVLGEAWVAGAKTYQWTGNAEALLPYLRGRIQRTIDELREVLANLS